MVVAFKGGGYTSGGHRTGVTSGFVGLGEYLAKGSRGRQSGQAHRVVFFGSNFDAMDIEAAAEQMQAVAEGRPRVTKPVYHFGFSLAKDGKSGEPLEQLTAVQWEAVVDRTILEMGLESHQVAWVVHDDAGHQHVHVLANRVPVREGPTWRVGHDHYPLRRVARWTEQEFGLRIVANPNPRQRNRWTDREFRAVRQGRGRSRNPETEKDKEKKQGQGWATFWTDAYPMFRDAVSWHDLQRRLGKRGFSIRPSTYHDHGLVLEYSGGGRKALSKVHRELSGPRLADRFGETFVEYQARNMGQVVVEEAEKEPLTVDRLISHMEAHHAVWDEQEALREARFYPNGEEVVTQLMGSSSERLVRLDSKTLTTAYMIELEEEVFDRAKAAAESRIYGVPLETSLDLTPEHREAVEHALGDRRLALIQGPAGSGKTRIAAAIAESYQKAGFEVVGSSVTGKAAQGLGEATGLDARTLAAWNRSWKIRPDGADLPAHRVMLVDEASMLSLEELKVLLRESGRSGMKLILIGDERQLPPVGPGHPYPRFLKDFGAYYLSEVHRQKEEWMRRATRLLSEGKTTEALDAYLERDRVHWTENLDEARTSLVLHWFDDRRRHPEESSMLLAYRNSDAKAMNSQIRALRRGDGELAEGILIHGQEFAPGDRILFRRNDRRQVRSLESGAPVAVQNGTLGTVSKVEPNHMEVELDSGTEVVFDPAVYRDVVHGYAVTLHKAQGATVDRAYVLADRHLEANGFVTAATRQRRDLQIYVPKSQVESVTALKEAIQEWAKPDLIREHVEVVESKRKSGRGRGNEPDPEKLADLKKEMRSLFRKLHGFGSRLPTAPEMQSIEERLQHLRESSFLSRPLAGSKGWAAEQGDNRLLLRRMVEQADLYRHQRVASEALDASWHAREEDHREAVDRLAGLAPVRLLPEPPEVMPEEVAIHRLPESVEDVHRQGIRRLEKRLARYRKGARQRKAARDGDEIALRAYWERVAKHTERRLRTVVETVEKRDRLLQAQAATPEGEIDPWILKKIQMAQTEGLGSLETSLDRLTRLRPTARETLASLQSLVGDVVWERTGQLGPAKEMMRLVDQLRRLQDTQKDHLRITQSRRRREDPEHLRRLIEQRHRNIRTAAWDRLTQIYRGDPEIRLRKAEKIVAEEGAESLLHTLKQEPEVIGPLKGIFKTQARTAAWNLAETYGAYFQAVKNLGNLLEEQLAEDRHLKDLRRQLVSLPSREELLESLLETSKALSDSERALLPEAVRRQVELLETEYRDLETEAVRHLQMLTNVLGDVAGTLGRYGARRAVMSLTPAPLRRVLYAAESLQALRANAPKYLLGRFMPRPLRLGLQMVEAISRGVSREVQRDRGMSW